MTDLVEAKDLVNGAIVAGPQGSITPAKMRAVLSALIDAVTFGLSSKADIDSPQFTGTPTVPLAPLADNTTKAASTSFVARAIAAATTGVASFNTRTGAVTLTSGDVTGALTYTPANIASPTFTGTPTAPSAADGTNTTQLSTTAFVQTAINLLKSTVSSGFDTLAKIETALGLKAPLASPTFTGTPAVPTAAPGTNTTQAASTAFVAAAVTGAVAGVASFNTRTGAVTLSSGDVTTALGFTPANTASPAFSGAPTAPLASDGDTTSKIANTTFVQNAVVLLKGGVSTTYDTLYKIANALVLKADASALTSGLAGKANTSHTHATSDVTGLDSALAGKVSSVVVNGGSAITGQYIASVTASISGGVLTITCTHAADEVGGGGGTGA